MKENYPWDDKTQSWSSCHRLDTANKSISYDIVTDDDPLNYHRETNTTRTIHCESYIYDRSTFDSTTTSEVFQLFAFCKSRLIYWKNAFIFRVSDKLIMKKTNEDSFCKLLRLISCFLFFVFFHLKIKVNNPSLLLRTRYNRIQFKTKNFNSTWINWTFKKTKN